MSQIAYETPQFRDDFRRASRQTQGKIEAFILKFTEDTTRGGLQLKSPKRSSDPRVKVARVDQGLRAVLVNLGEQDYALVRVMEHDAAYEWASTLRPDVSSFNGLPRLLEVPFQAPDQAELTQEPTAGKDLFDHRRDRDFVRVGVPEFAVRALRAMPDPDGVGAFADLLGVSDPLLGLAIHRLLEPDQTVDEIYAELIELEGGPSAETLRTDGVWNGASDGAAAETMPIDTADLDSALQRPGADERFRVVEDSEELVEALRGEFDAWMVFLHPLQRKAAYARYNGPARISGGAGTGKSVVLLHRAKALLDRVETGTPPRILITTFTNHLQQDLKRLLAQLVGDEAAAAVDVRTVDGLARDLHGEMTGTRASELTSDDERLLWEEVAPLADGAQSARFLSNEYRHVVLAQGVHTPEDYATVSRSGRGVRLSARARRALWPAFEAFEARTRQAGRYSTLQLTESVASLLQRLPAQMYDHVLVDEAQDLHASQWRLLRAVVPEQADDLFLVGDAFQRIYGDTVSLRTLGIETRGRSLRLRRNYRTTHEIVGWLLGLVGDETVVDLDELGADLSGYHSVRHGPNPAFAAFETPAAELSHAVDTVAEWLSAGRPADAIAVTTRNNDQLPQIVTALQRAGLPAAQLGRRGRVLGSVNVATMHRLKGLEYACVAVTGLSEGVVPPPGEICPIGEDPAQHMADLNTERSLVYVAATRARDELLISWSGAPSPLLQSALAPAVGIRG